MPWWIYRNVSTWYDDDGSVEFEKDHCRQQAHIYVHSKHAFWPYFRKFFSYANEISIVISKIYSLFFIVQFIFEIINVMHQRYRVAQGKFYTFYFLAENRLTMIYHTEWLYSTKYSHISSVRRKWLWWIYTAYICHFCFWIA